MYGTWGNPETQRHGRWSAGRGAAVGFDAGCRLAHCGATGAHLIQYCGISHLQVDGSPSECGCSAIRVYCPAGGSRIVAQPW